MRRVGWMRHLGIALGDYPNALRFRLSGLGAGSRRSPPGSGDGRPVVILPGVYESWHFLRAIAERIAAAGHPVHVVPAIGINRAPIPAVAARVAEELARLELHGVALVAHSKGGLVGKQLMTFLDPEGRVDRLIAIATPFGGARLARRMLGPTMREFRPESPVIRDLVAEPAVDARITSIFPRFDPHIPEGSALPGARNVEIDVVGHFRVLRHPATADAVLEALAADPAPDAAPGLA